MNINYYTHYGSGDVTDSSEQIELELRVAVCIT
jgi:hypothetical protein